MLGNGEEHSHFVSGGLSEDSLFSLLDSEQVAVKVNALNSLTEDVLHENESGHVVPESTKDHLLVPLELCDAEGELPPHL